MRDIFTTIVTPLLLAGSMAHASFRGETWSVSGHLPDGFKAAAVLSLSDGHGLIGGCQEDTDDFDVCSAGIFLASGSELHRVYHGNGSVRVMAASGNAVFAGVSIYVRGGQNRHRVLRSDDGGEHFTHDFDVPGVDELTELLAISPTEIWCRAGETFLHSTDGGRTWATIRTLTLRNVIRERLAFDGTWLYVLGDTIHRTRDHGASWSQIETGGAYVPVLSNGAVAGLRDTRLIIGRIAGSAITWEAQEKVADGVKPLKLAVRGNEAVIATSPERRIWSTLSVFSYEPDRGWKRTAIEATYESRLMDMAPSGTVYAVQAGGTVIHNGPRD